MKIDSMDTLLNTPVEEIKEILEKETLGTLASLSNLLKMQYGQCTNIKNSLVALIDNEVVPVEDKEKAENTLKNVYIALQLIEDRYNLIVAVIKGKN